VGTPAKSSNLRFLDATRTSGRLAPHQSSMFTAKYWKRGLIGLLAIGSVGLTVAHENSRSPKSLPATEDALLADSKVPPQARSILERACQDCHSDNTVSPWYADVPPISWQIHRDVARGRALINLSKWSEYSESERRGFARAILAATKARIMPPPMYVLIHGNARLSDEDLKELEKWATAETRVRSRKP
jgi:hypothetical protein